MYYHVSAQPLAVGTELAPGEYGRKLLEVGVDGVFAINQEVFYWEVALETAGLAIDPALPSRLTSTFLWTSLPAAMVFRHRFRKGGHVYEVEVLEAHPIFCGDFNIITTPRVNQPYLGYMPEIAGKYWQLAGEPQIAEYLYAGPIRIIRELEQVSEDIQALINKLHPPA